MCTEQNRHSWIMEETTGGKAGIDRRGGGVISEVPDVWRVVACEGHSRGQEAPYFPLLKLKHLILRLSSFLRFQLTKSWFETQGSTPSKFQAGCVCVQVARHHAAALVNCSIVQFPMTNTLADKERMSCSHIILLSGWCLAFSHH